MPRKYEALFIFAGNIKDEALEKVIEQSATEIQKLGGVIESTETLGRRTFARTMQKRDHGVYVKFYFSIEPEKVKKIHTRFKHNDDCFRLQITIRNERVEAAKKADNLRRSLFKASLDAAAEVANIETDQENTVDDD